MTIDTWNYTCVFKTNLYIRNAYLIKYEMIYVSEWLKLIIFKFKNQWWNKVMYIKKSEMNIQ